MEAVVISKEDEARAVVHKYMLGNAAVSLIPVPLFDLVALTGVQLKMVHALATLYGLDFRGDVVKGSLISLVGSLGSMSIGAGIFLSALKFIPAASMTVGVLALPASSAAFTYAVGRVFIMHFEAGGTLLDFDPKKMHAYFRQSFQDGLKIAKEQPAEKVVVAKAEAAEKKA